MLYGMFGLGAQEILILGVCCFGIFIPIAVALVVLKSANKPKPPTPRDEDAEPEE